MAAARCGSTASTPSSCSDTRGPYRSGTGRGGGARAGSARPALAPGAQGREHRDELLPGLGEVVLVALRRLAVALAAEHTGLDQELQPGREPIARGAGALLDAGEPVRAEVHLAHHQQRPPVAHQLQRGRGGAVAPRQVRQVHVTCTPSVWTSNRLESSVPVSWKVKPTGAGVSERTINSGAGTVTSAAPPPTDVGGA